MKGFTGPTYEARGRVYVAIEDLVSTSLLSFSGAVRDRLLAALGAEAEAIASVARGSVAAHGTGRLARSIRSTGARTIRDTAVLAVIKMGGTRTTKHGHAFEHGFDGVVNVSAHSGKPAPQDPHRRGRRKAQGPLGKPFDVKAYRRHMSYRGHGYLRGAVAKQRNSVRNAVLDAIGDTASAQGLTP